MARSFHRRNVRAAASTRAGMDETGAGSAFAEAAGHLTTLTDSDFFDTERLRGLASKSRTDRTGSGLYDPGLQSKISSPATARISALGRVQQREAGRAASETGAGFGLGTSRTAAVETRRAGTDTLNAIAGVEASAATQAGNLGSAASQLNAAAERADAAAQNELVNFGLRGEFAARSQLATLSASRAAALMNMFTTLFGIQQGSEDTQRGQNLGFVSDLIGNMTSLRSASLSAAAGG